MIDLDEDTPPNVMKSDRVIILKPMEGKRALSSAATSLPDARLFTGENKLHAIMNPCNGLWSMQYERGVLPGNLTGQFTTFEKLLTHARSYYGRRNVEIVEVID